MSASQQKWWAILIGINAYPERILPLEGCIRDVEDVEEYVRNAAGASNMDIDVAKFTDESLSSPPTYENISQAFDRVSKQVASNDVVYFHFSGHGGRQWRTLGDQHPDKRTMEPGYERYFESLVLLGERHMKDYELGRHFDCLASKGAALFAVLDCCHSGGGDRTDDQNVRQVDFFLPPDQLSRLPEEIVADDAEPALRGAFIPTSYWTRARDYTMLAACQPHQFAKEVEDDKGQMRGALTLTLMASLRALRRDGQHLTYKILFDDISGRIGMHPRAFGQCPKMFGLDGREVFSSTTYSSCSQATVEDVCGSRIRIDKGAIQGIETDDVWAIYPRGSPHLDAPIAEISINRVEANQAYGELSHVSPPETQTVEPGCPASLLIPKYGRLLHVFVENSDLRRQLTDQPPIGVQFHGDNYEGVAYRVRDTKAGGHELTNKSGEPLRDAPLYEPGLSYVSKLHKFLKKLAHYTRILQLSNAKNDLEGEFQFREMSNKTKVKHKDYIELEFKNLRDKPSPTAAKRQNSQASLYFNVLNIRPNKSVHLLTEQLVEPGNNKRESFDMIFPEIDSDVPEVLDILKVIVTDKPVSLESLETNTAWRSDAPVLNDFHGVFRQILEEAGSGDGDGTSRDVVRRNASRALEVKWQTCQLSLTVTKNN